MLECLKDYIGLQGYCPSGGIVPESGVYVNELPGVTFEMVSKITTMEKETALATWGDVQSRAIRRFERDFRTFFFKRYSTICCVENCKLEDVICGMKDKLIDVLLFALGIELMLERLYSSRINFFTLVTREEATELKDFFQVEYEKAVQDIEVPTELIEDCYICEPRIKRIEVLP